MVDKQGIKKQKFVRIQNKRAAFFTVSAIIMILVVLFLLSFVLQFSRDENANVLDQLLFGRIHDLDDSLQKSVRTIFESRSGISVSSNSTAVIFNEYLLNAQASLFNSRILELNDFVESKNSRVVFNEPVKENFTLKVRPYNITYKHIDYGQDILVVSETGYVDFNYFIYAKMNENVTCSSATTPGSFGLRVKAQGLGNSCDDSFLVNPLLNSSINVNNGALIISLNNNSLSINRAVDANVTTTLNLADAGSAALVVMPDVFRINFLEFGMTKQGDVSINT
ncbi:MAG: hypothetical protein Q8O89_08625 [Nanoarchaeota archaeon]|nr:hypothetical protein [Nanoarchaeota archaeon]